MKPTKPPHSPAAASAIAPSGFFAFRTPLLPFDVLETWGAGLEGPVAAAPDRARALARDRALLEARLRAIVTEPVVREALFVASPSLDDAIDAWLVNPASERAHGVVEILVRYLARMCARATPFGLFSGCAVAPLGKETRLALAPRSAYRRHTRLDTHYLSALCDELQKDAEIRRAARFTPSSGLFPSAGQLRYAEGRIDPVTRERSFHLVSVELSDYLAATMERARDGATRGALAAALVEADPEIALEEAEGFIDQLVDSQILVSDLAPAVTGREPIDDIVHTLRASASPRAVEAAACLAAVERDLDAMDASGLGLEAARYKDVARALAALPAKTELPRLFQVDLFKPAAGATLGGAPLREIQQTVARLARMRRHEGRGEALRRFREAFIERYEGREVPLVDALDDERGIGFESATAGSSEPSPLLDDLHFPGAPAARGSWGAHDDWLLRALAKKNDAARAVTGDVAREWMLDDEDMKALEAETPASLPDAFAVMATLAAPSPEALAKGDFTLFMNGLSGPSGALLLGRFCHGDEELRARVEAHLRAEEALRPDAVFAEVVHLPEGRLGNILCRPTLRAYEIPFLGRSGVPEDRQIPITDLRVSVRGERIVLRSARLGKEVLPRLTSAHNHPMAALGTYRFLCALQVQDGDAGLGWSWGALSSAPYLPRVRHGRVVLAMARWVIAKEAIAPLAKGDLAARFEATQALRARLALPRWVGVADADNVLPVDLDNVLSVESFVALVKNRPMVTLQEMHPLPDALCTTGPEGRFAHEVVVPFVRVRAPDASASPPMREAAPSSPARRTFPPGSEWLYAKLYTGTATADRVLRELVAPLVAESLAEGDADRWFFIRYSDPRWHLRVRLHGDPGRLTSRVLPRLHALAAGWLDDQRLSRLQLDTYEREVERYGGDRAMDACEQIFAADSEATLAIMASLSGDEAADARWRLALRGMHLLLEDLGLDLEARRALLTSTRASFAAEHRADGALERQLGAKFRKERPSIEWALRAPVDPGDGEVTALHPGFAALAERSERIAAPARALTALESEGAHATTRASLAGSLLHMHANRMLRSEQRAQELVLYDFLARIYDSELARSAKRGAQNKEKDGTAAT